MTEHLHTAYVEGCYRCDLSGAEARDSLEYWEDALGDLIRDLDETGQIDLYEYHSTADVVVHVGTVIDELCKHVKHGSLDSPTIAPSLPAWWRVLLRLSLSRVAVELGLSEVEALDHVSDVVISKQHDYGHGNIAKFGQTGIIIRVSDKYERLLNLLELGEAPAVGDEPLVNTWGDLVGYSLIALMWIDGTFMLPLRPTTQYDGDYVEYRVDLDEWAASRGPEQQFDVREGYGDEHAWLGDVSGPQ